MTIDVLRGGVTSNYWSGNGYSVSLSGDTENKRLVVGFLLDSKGGGTTQVSVRVEVDSFEEVATSMMKADSKAAIKAFGKALAAVKL